MRYSDLRKKGDMIVKMTSDDPESNIRVESMRFVKNLEQAIAWRNDFTESIEKNHGGFDECKASDLNGRFERFLLKVGFPVTLVKGRKNDHTWKVTVYK